METSVRISLSGFALVIAAVLSAYSQDIEVAPDQVSCPIYFSYEYPGDPAMKPGSSYWGTLGTSANRFYSAWISQIHYYNLQTWSDERMKENVRALDPAGVYERVGRLRPIKYDLIVEDAKEQASEKERARLEEIRGSMRDKYGLIAQELMGEFPELVDQDSASGAYSVDMVGLIPILITCIQRQQELIDNQNKRIDALASQLSGKQ